LANVSAAFGRAGRIRVKDPGSGAWVSLEKGPARVVAAQDPGAPIGARTRRRFAPRRRLLPPGTRMAGGLSPHRARLAPLRVPGGGGARKHARVCPIAVTHPRLPPEPAPCSGPVPMRRQTGGTGRHEPLSSGRENRSTRGEFRFASRGPKAGIRGRRRSRRTRQCPPRTARPTIHHGI
jgi:hypothetical protein